MKNEHSQAARSLACNPAVLMHHRNRLNLTQRDLAKVAGYTERLISKAEAGQPISIRTISDLADALSCQDVTVTSADLTCDPLSLAKRYIGALHSRSERPFGLIEPFLHEEAIFWIAGDAKVIPFAGEHRGKAAIQRALELFFSVLEAPADHPWEKHYRFQADGNEVLVFGKSWIHPIGQPMTEPITVSQRILFREGLLFRIEDVFDTLAGAEALNKSGGS